MSYTQIYKISENKNDLELFNVGETQNAWRGAMYVWNQIAVDYLGLSSFPSFGDDDDRMRVWNADSTHNLKDYEAIVLLSTMDKSAVKKEDIARIISAFKEYGIDNPGSSFSEQADLIEKESFQDGDVLVWNQTSVNGDLWFADYSYCEEDDEDVMIIDISQCWSVFDGIEYEEMSTPSEIMINGKDQRQGN